MELTGCLALFTMLFRTIPLVSRVTFNRGLRKAAGFVAALSLPLFLCPIDVFGQESIEYRVKAGFVLNFLKLTEFPHDRRPLTVCVDGEDTVLRSFERLEDESVAGAPVKVLLLVSSAQDDLCAAVFVAGNRPVYSRRVAGRFRGKSTLVIGETEGFARDAGTINFYTQKNKFRFEVNLDAARRAGLKLSSKLLRLARIVQDEEDTP